MAQEWPDYEKELKAEAKAEKRGDSFIVSDDDSELGHNKWKQKGWFTIYLIIH